MLERVVVGMRGARELEYLYRAQLEGHQLDAIVMSVEYLLHDLRDAERAMNRKSGTPPLRVIGHGPTPTVVPREYATKYETLVRKHGAHGVVFGLGLRRIERRIFKEELRHIATATERPLRDVKAALAHPKVLVLVAAGKPRLAALTAVELLEFGSVSTLRRVIRGVVR